MNTKTKKVLLVAMLTCAIPCLQGAHGVTKKKVQTRVTNPLMKPSTLPFGAPDFSKIKAADYVPAIQAGIRQQRQEIANIVNNKHTPTFENTI